LLQNAWSIPIIIALKVEPETIDTDHGIGEGIVAVQETDEKSPMRELESLHIQATRINAVWRPGQE
jgi:hypothetical protein